MIYIVKIVHKNVLGHEEIYKVQRGGASEEAHKQRGKVETSQVFDSGGGWFVLRRGSGGWQSKWVFLMVKNPWRFMKFLT